MTEPTPAPPPPPAPAPSPTPAQRPEGSFAAGYFGGGLVMFMSLVVTGGLIATLPSALSAVFLLLPLATLIGLIVYCIKDGKRTIKGLIAMLLTFVGLVVLLVAACFGYFAIHPLNFH